MLLWIALAETIIENKKFIPYLICAYNGTEYIESFSNNQKELFANFLKGLLSFFNLRPPALNTNLIFNVFPPAATGII